MLILSQVWTFKCWKKSIVLPWTTVHCILAVWPPCWHVDLWPHYLMLRLGTIALIEWTTSGHCWSSSVCTHCMTVMRQRKRLRLGSMETDWKTRWELFGRGRGSKTSGTKILRQQNRLLWGGGTMKQFSLFCKLQDFSHRKLLESLFSTEMAAPYSTKGVINEWQYLKIPLERHFDDYWWF